MKIIKITFILFASLFAVTSSFAQVITDELDYIGWTNFSTVGGVDTNIVDTAADFDSSGGFLSGILGQGASGNGYGAYGSSTGNFLNDSTFGDDITFSGGTGNSAIKFITNDGRHRLDLLVKNESTTYDFKLAKLHFDVRIPNGNSNETYTVQYLSNNGKSSLLNVSTQSNVSNLAVIGSDTLTVGSHGVDLSIATNLSGSGPVRLGAGDQASFRITWTGSAAAFAQTQIDNIAFSGKYLVPEPSTYALIAGFATFLFVAIKRRK